MPGVTKPTHSICVTLLQVCDLGLARDIESGCRELTEYVVTRWYRAPEIMLACQEYSKVGVERMERRGPDRV